LDLKLHYTSPGGIFTEDLPRLEHRLDHEVISADDPSLRIMTNELMLNFGANLQNNIFDQNRTFAALGIRNGP
jgi:hypothetical protein